MFESGEWAMAPAGKAQPWDLRPRGVFVALVVFLGVAVCVPGALMRLETVPPPRPFVRVHLCPTAEGDFKGSGTPCSGVAVVGNSTLTAGREQTQAIPLHSRMLVSGVEYLPVLLVPDTPGDGVAAPLTGHVSFRLTAPGGREYFSLTQKLNAAPGEGRTVVARHAEGYEVLAYEQFGDTALLPSDCNRIEVGCTRRIDVPTKEVMLTHTRFQVDESLSRPLEVFARNLTLELRTALVVGGATHGPESLPPPLYVSFRQSELSEIQASGVRIVLAGAAIAFVGIAVWWGGEMLNREKSHSH